MGLWQHLVASYEKNVEALNKTYPLSTTSISNNSGFIAIIVIDGNGRYLDCNLIEKKADATKTKPVRPIVNITIPASEKSLTRTSTAISPYPVFDKYEYLKGDGDKFDAYVKQLKDFAESQFATEKVKAIYRYIEKRTVASDLSAINVKDKTYILFEVQIPGNSLTKTWEDETLFYAWHHHYLSEKRKLSEKKKSAEKALSEKNKLSSDERTMLKQQVKLKETTSLDYVTGTTQPIAAFHPKKISNASANAKLISSNDKTNYTFRGKFCEPSEAVLIGYDTSQKAHQFLRYLINDHRGSSCGEQVIISFTIGSMKEPLPAPIKDQDICMFLEKSNVETESDRRIRLSAGTGFDYADALRKSLAGFGHDQALKRHVKTAVCVLDAVSDKTGRLSITFYRELDRNEYLESIAHWHNTCKWNNGLWSKENQKIVPYIGAPSIDKIIEAVYGKPRGDKDESYTKIKKGARERLLHCIFDKALMPVDYVTGSVRRASKPLSITKNGKFDRQGFDRILSTTCALVNKDYQQKNKEGFKLSIELERKDRDYLYGRLLGAADKLEEYALYQKGNSRDVTAAIRYMQTFAQHPYRTWKTIHGCLNPYIQTEKVKKSFAYNDIQSIMNLFDISDYEADTPLNGSYIIGYYHERTHIDDLIKSAGHKAQSNQ